MPALSFEDDLLDARVRLETMLGETLEGAVFVAYEPAQYIVLETPAGKWALPAPLELFTPNAD